MEYLGGGAGTVLLSSSNVPAFLTKLWTLVEDPDTDPLICWSPNGNSFHVFDQGRFSKEVLPKYFKHNNMASFVRQLNMYGFRKVVHIEQGGLVKPEKDDTEFQHPYFIRGQEHLLENIKRKVTNVSNIKHEDLKMNQEDVSKLLSDVQVMREKQETIDSKIITMKQENEALWREVATLRQKHSQQQKVVNKLIQFLITLVQSNRVLGMKRKIPLMLNDSSSAHSMPKFSRQYSLEHMQGTSAFSAPTAFGAANLFSSDDPMKSGPIISDVTDMSQSSPSEITDEWTEERTSPLVHIKEEPGSPACSPEVEPLGEVGVCVPADTPLSPTTFINSILQDNEPIPTPTPTPTPTPAPAPAPIELQGPKCLSVARLDKSPQMLGISCVIPSPSPHPRAPPGCELADHLESIDSGLENLQAILNGQSINFDPSPLFDIFSTSLSNTEFSLPDLDSSLASIQDLLVQDQKAAETSTSPNDAGKQLVQYTAQPLLLADPVSADNAGEDLPILLELEGDSYFGSDAEDPASSLLSSDYQSNVSGETQLS
ncbi:heat shock factor protein 1 isoform X1 [Brienomyrus brachyistius]|uniref:heat shock factor protein 1 isoform X1 n=1 Tax=Brienomyrus brachyistius TaxID=42636 RepID=UPI0020B2FA48|nr:heat shock factor protein 1 isoform X1 [Brienomyrus brachyistius]